MRAKILGGITGMMLVGWAAQPAYATFHLMQIEQIIGGVSGDTAAQAIQLRTRSGGQNIVAASRIRAWDAAGANPVVIINIGSNLTGPSQTGDRILITTAAFNALTTPTAVPDFTMTAPIPASYLAAGSLTFEQDNGSVYWRVSWGGASYTGLTTGLTDNDDDGDFGPPYSGALATNLCYALQFQGTATAVSTTNAAQYAVIDTAPTSFMNYSDNVFVMEQCIPAASTWGLVAMALALLSAATVMVVRHHRFSV